MKPLSIPAKSFPIAFCIVIVILIAIPAVPADSVAGSPNSSVILLPFISINEDNASLPVFSSTEEVQMFLKSHTVPVATWNRNLQRSFSGSSGTISVTDCNDTRVWRYTLDTSSFKPDEYLVRAGAINEDVMGYTLFNLLGGTRTEKVPKMNRTVHIPAEGEKYYITVDPIGDRYVGERFTITGTTNLPAGEDILLEAYSSTFIPTSKSQSEEFSGASATTGNSESPGALDYSTTNIQVTGVDEADIVKTDGTNIYALSGHTLKILKAYPAQEARILASLTVNGTPVSLYVNGDRLVLFTTEITDSSLYPTIRSKNQTSPKKSDRQIFVQ